MDPPSTIFLYYNITKKENYMGCPTQYSVSLSQEEKEKLLAMSKDNKLSARVSKSVLILLALDNKTNSDIVD